MPVGISSRYLPLEKWAFKDENTINETQLAIKWTKNVDVVILCSLFLFWYSFSQTGICWSLKTPARRPSLRTLRAASRSAGGGSPLIELK